MTVVSERPSPAPWPPIVYLAAAALAVGLHLWMPLPWLGTPAADLLFVIGLLLCAFALAIDVFALRTLWRAGTTVMPHRPSAHLVTDGPFSFTRNPIYLGNTLLMIGAGLVAGVLWLVLLAPAAAFATQKLAIEGEERHLADRFGKRYRDYQKKVRRWI